MRRLQHYDLLNHYFNLLDNQKALRIKELWLDKNIELENIYSLIIKDYSDLRVTLNGLKIEDIKINSKINKKYVTEGSVLILTAMLYLNEADRSSIWQKFKGGFNERETDGMTIGEYHARLKLENQLAVAV
jgi:hypothetical protein